MSTAVDLEEFANDGLIRLSLERPIEIMLDRNDVGEEISNATFFIIENFVGTYTGPDSCNERHQSRPQLSVERNEEIKTPTPEFADRREHFRQRIFLCLIVENDDIVDDGIIDDCITDDAFNHHGDASVGEMFFDESEGGSGEYDVAEIDEGADEDILIHSITAFR